MTKAELVAKIAYEVGIAKSLAEKALDGFVSAVSAALSGGDKITLVGFGTFSVMARSLREGRNPRTGEVIRFRRQKLSSSKQARLSAKKSNSRI